jgi:hypothetical protein
MRAPTYDEVQLLKLVAGEPCGVINQEDERLAPFCSDASTLTAPDVFNSCIDLGWLHARHDNSSDHHTAEITVPGKRAITDPRPYELDRPEERKRLFREVTGYLHTCRKCGGDFDGRRYAKDAAETLAKE